MSNEELDDLIKSIKNEHPLSGETETAHKAFLSGAKVSGLPAWVRGDCGTENVVISEYTQHKVM